MITYLDNSDFESELLFFCKRKDQSGSGNQGPRQRAAALAALPYAFNSSSALRMREKQSKVQRVHKEMSKMVLVH
ncbi:hypothetical protein ISN44_As10g010520 [Arabidopsis suecica]|uniref:Uncharacterized protein n=1 Tax=Arabidopsis suecica TaxID=45249 RepID=A0A8T1ZTX2_ARASU|nr:hypothetical protein ISN44_As10g010520 [Arabidopsis suecica]